MPVNVSSQRTLLIKLLASSLNRLHEIRHTPYNNHQTLTLTFPANDLWPVVHKSSC